MAKLIPNAFTSWELTPEEELRGAILDLGQTQVIQNHLAQLAEEKLALSYDPSAPDLYTQDEAYKRGQIDLLNYLLEISTTSKVELPNFLNPSLT